MISIKRLFNHGYIIFTIIIGLLLIWVSSNELVWTTIINALESKIDVLDINEWLGVLGRS